MPRHDRYENRSVGVCTHVWLYSLGITWTQTEIKVVYVLYIYTY